MWRWVTRGLVLTLLSALLAPALLAQTPGFIGSLDSPDPAVTQSGVILVKGWAYDPQQISKIELFVDDQFQYPVVMNLPRIDIVEAYTNWPGIHNAKPGFQVGFLGSRFTNGAHTVFVKISFSDNRTPVELGRRTITVDNTLNQAPFGSVDMPDAAGVYNTSNSFPVVGWAADTDGVSRVEVLIDGGIMQNAMYGDPRPDVAEAFPDFATALFSGFIANIDTTRVQDGVHLLEVRAVDKLGMSRRIGVRQVQILNSESNLPPFGHIDTPLRDAVLYGTLCGPDDSAPVSPFVRPQAFITPISGWALDLGARVDLGRVSYVELMVDGVRVNSTDNCAVYFGGYANCYGVPRYDVQRFYPNYPDAPRAGFVFTLDVGGLIRAGFREGNHVLKIRVGDLQQTVTELPGPQGLPVFFRCADTSFTAPAIGFIDVPTPLIDYVRGDTVFSGWALDFDGIAAVEMIIDGNYVGQASYGFPRSDVHDVYPNYFTSGQSGWRFTMDTTKLSNARHRLTVRVLDSQGRRSEIGSADFYVSNLNPTP